MWRKPTLTDPKTHKRTPEALQVAAQLAGSGELLQAAQVALRWLETPGTHVTREDVCGILTDAIDRVTRYELHEVEPSGK